MSELVPKIVIDNDLRSIGIEAISTMHPNTINWSNAALAEEVALTEDVIAMKNTPSKDASRQGQEYERQKLWTLRKLIERRKIQLCNYWGLEWEARANKNTRTFHIGIFDRLEQRELQLHALPPELVGLCSFQSRVKPSEVTQRLLAINEKTFAMFMEHKTPGTPSFWGQHFLNLKRLRHLTSRQSHYADALHLWICELNNVGYFVTADNKFRRFMLETLKTESSVRIISPTELLLEMNEPVIPFPAHRVVGALSILDLDD